MMRFSGDWHIFLMGDGHAISRYSTCEISGAQCEKTLTLINRWENVRPRLRLILRIFQHTPGTYPRPPTNGLWFGIPFISGFRDSWGMLQGYVGVFLDSFFCSSPLAYMDPPDMYFFFCLFGRFLLAKSSQILHTWKIQVYFYIYIYL